MPSLPVRVKLGRFAGAYIAALAAVCGAEEVATFNRGDFRKLGVRCRAI